MKPLFQLNECFSSTYHILPGTKGDVNSTLEGLRLVGKTF